jgi:hypothetical protein
MKPTVNDKICVAMLLFIDDICKYLPDILSKTKSAPSGSSNNNNNNRANLDASNARKKRGKLLLLNAFKDSDVVANLPAAWKDAAEYIDKKWEQVLLRSMVSLTPMTAQGLLCLGLTSPLTLFSRCL